MARAARKKISFGTSMGVSSIIAILVILVLVVFSALSITTSKADLKLSQKTADSIKAFYEADAAAEDKMAEIDALLAGGNAWQAEAQRAGFAVSAGEYGETLVSYTIPVDEYRNLNVELLVSSDGKMARRLWQIVPANEWVADEGLNLAIP